MPVGGHGEACSAGAIARELAVDEPWPASSTALFWCHWRAGPADSGVPGVSGLDLDASSFISEMYVNFEKS